MTTHAGAAPSPMVEPLARLRPDIQVLPGRRERNGAPGWLLFDPVRDRYFSIGWLERELLNYWDCLSAPDIVEQVLQNSTLDLDEDEVVGFNQYLVENELVQCQSQNSLELFQRRRVARTHQLGKTRMQRQLFKRFSLVHPDRFLATTLPLVRPLMSHWWRRLMLVLAICCAFLVMRQWTQFSQAVVDLFSWNSAPLVLVALALIKVVHELGHAYTCKYYGLSVPTMGIALFVIWPFLFTNTNAAWRLTQRRSRLAVGLAGVLSECYVAILCIALWFVVPDGAVRTAALFLGTVSLGTTIAINANPFMRWDGYYVLADWLQVENLQPRAFGLTKWWLRRTLLGLDDPRPDAFDNTMSRILIVYAVLTWLYRLVLFIGLSMLAYAGLFKLLGIVAAGLVLYWFVVNPVASEIRVLVKRRRELSFNRHSIIFLLLIATGVWLLVAPLDATVSRQAHLKVADQQRVYSPVSGRIKYVAVSPATQVTQGDVLFEVESVENRYELVRVLNKQNYYKSIQRRQADRQVLQEQTLLKTQLEYLDGQKNGLLEQQQRMRVKAPLSGRIASMSDHLREGTYVSTRQPLAHVISTDAIKIIAYVDTTDLQRLTIGTVGVFVPSDLNTPSRPVELIEIDTSPALTLESPVLAKIHGGDVPVVGEPRDATPAGAYFRLSFKLSESTGARELNPTLGTVHIAATKRSLISQVVDGLSGLVVRESGF